MINDPTSDQNIKDLRRAMMAAVLKLAPNHGVDPATLTMAAVSINLDPALVPLVYADANDGGVGSFLEAFRLMIDESLRHEVLSTPAFGGYRTPEKVQECLVMRLSLLSPHRRVVDAAMSYYATPTRFVKGQKALLAVADTIWHLCGDTSLDWNYYSKRILLAYVFATTLKKWHNSPDTYTADQMRPFIKKQIDRVTLLPRSVKTLAQQLKGFFGRA